jgi:hypothetical protein
MNDGAMPFTSIHHSNHISEVDIVVVVVVVVLYIVWLAGISSSSECHALIIRRKEDNNLPVSDLCQ